jgi:hypothetical protein
MTKPTAWTYGIDQAGGAPGKMAAVIVKAAALRRTRKLPPAGGPISRLTLTFWSVGWAGMSVLGLSWLGVWLVA